MEITVRDLVTVLHGWASAHSSCWPLLARWPNSIGCPSHRFRRNKQSGADFVRRLSHRHGGSCMANGVFGCLHRISGYSGSSPAGLTDLSEYPRRLLLSSGKTSEWHNVGMEWKEHVSWLAPIAMTMVAYVTLKYRQAITRPRHMRTAVLGFAVAAFIATGVLVRSVPS